MVNNIAYYNAHAEEYFLKTVSVDMTFWQERFISYLPVGAHILDAGCGSGRDSLGFIKKGFCVTAFDASAEMCRLASNLINQQVFHLRFEDIDYEEEFNGIWACASLLHVPEESLLDVMNHLHRALKPDGILYASFKFGKGETMQEDRCYTNMDESALKVLLEQSGFEVLQIEMSEDTLEEKRHVIWVNGIGKKKSDETTKEHILK